MFGFLDSRISVRRGQKSKYDNESHRINYHTGGGVGFPYWRRTSDREREDVEKATEEGLCAVGLRVRWGYMATVSTRGRG